MVVNRKGYTDKLIPYCTADYKAFNKSPDLWVALSAPEHNMRDNHIIFTELAYPGYAQQRYRGSYDAIAFPRPPYQLLFAPVSERLSPDDGGTAPVALAALPWLAVAVTDGAVGGSLLMFFNGHFREEYFPLLFGRELLLDLDEYTRYF